jgi:isocitrate dehydrogenase kinase/phosphatase
MVQLYGFQKVWKILLSKIVGPKKQDFFPRINMKKELKNSADELWFIKKYQNRTLKVDFLCQKLSESFQNKFSLKNINLGHQLMFNFKNNLFLKSCPIFDEPSFINGIF